MAAMDLSKMSDEELMQMRNHVAQQDALQQQYDPSRQNLSQMSEAQLQALRQQAFAKEHPFLNVLKNIPQELKAAGQGASDVGETLAGNVMKYGLKVVNPLQVTPQWIEDYRQHAGKQHQPTPGTPEASAYDLGRFLSEGATMGVAGPVGQELGPVGRAAGRVIPAATTAGLLSEHPGQAALMTGAIGLGLETIPFIGRMLKGISEKLIPKEFTKNMSTRIQDLYGTSLNKAVGIYTDLKKNLGNEYVVQPTKLDEFATFDKGQAEKYLSRDTLKWYQEFKNNPTYANAHELQSNMFKDAAAESRAGNSSSANNIFSMRNDFNNSVQNWMDRNYPHASASLKEANHLYGEVVKPMETNPKLYAISTKAISPKNVEYKELQSALKGFESSKKVRTNVKSEHELSEMAEKLREKNQSIKNTKALIDLFGAGMGAVGGHAAGGLLGGSLGSSLGGLATHALSPSAAQLIQTFSDPLGRMYDPVVEALLKLQQPVLEEHRRQQNQ